MKNLIKDLHEEIAKEMEQEYASLSVTSCDCGAGPVDCCMIC